MLYLTRSDIEELVSMSDIIDVVEKAFRAKALGRTRMPPKVYITFDRYRGDFRAMPAYLEDEDSAGVKIVNVHPENPEKYGLPTVMATIVLLDPKNGMPTSIMDGTWITNMRTGAAGGIAAKYLARKDSRVVGMVGAGAQARTQLLALNEIFRIEEVKVTSLTAEGRKKFSEETEGRLGLRVTPKDSIEEAVRNCDIVVTTTPVTKPIVKNEWIAEGTHINAIGADAPGKEELDPELLKRAKIVVDDYEQACHSGEVNVPLSKGMITRDDIYAELGDIIVGKKAGRVSDEEITIFDSTGLAIQDIATAWLVHQEAKKRGLGKEIDLFRHTASFLPPSHPQ